MNIKVIVVFIVSVALFTFAAAYRFYDSAHAIGTIKKGGGKARHAALLESDRDSYILIATAAVIPPYRGNARVVLEGDPALSATFHNSGPVVDLGIYRHPEFRDNTYYDLQPKDKVAVWVKIKRARNAPAALTASSAASQVENTAAPQCSQCDPGSGEQGAQKPDRMHAKTAAPAQEQQPGAPSTGAVAEYRSKQGSGKPDAGGSGPEGRGSGKRPVKGPAVAFYDTATNERLLTIPIKFTGSEGGDANGH